MKEINENSDPILVARKLGFQQGRITAIVFCLRMLIRKQGLSAQEAMALLDLPHKERKTYIKILQNNQKN